MQVMPGSTIVPIQSASQPAAFTPEVLLVAGVFVALLAVIVTAVAWRLRKK